MATDMVNNTQVFEAFARGETAQGGSVASVSVVVPEGETIVLYSYGTPIAFKARHAAAPAHFDPRTYSNTTSKHQAGAKRACGDNYRVDEEGHKHFRQVLRELGVSLIGAR